MTRTTVTEKETCVQAVTAETRIATSDKSKEDVTMKKVTVKQAEYFRIEQKKTAREVIDELRAS